MSFDVADDWTLIETFPLSRVILWTLPCASSLVSNSNKLMFDPFPSLGISALLIFMTCVCLLLLMRACCLAHFPRGFWNSQCVCLLCMSLEPLQIIPVALQLKRGGVEGSAACRATVFSWSPLSCSLALSLCLQCWTTLQNANLESAEGDWALVPPCAWQEAGICSALLMQECFSSLHTPVLVPSLAGPAVSSVLPLHEDARVGLEKLLNEHCIPCRYIQGALDVLF